MSFTVGRTARALGETPRTWALPSVSRPFSGNEAITTTSGLTSAPASPRSTPGASSTTRTCSSVTLLSISEVAPARLTIALRADPEATDDRVEGEVEEGQQASGGIAA